MSGPLLVVGGTGFLGRAVVAAAVRGGDRVVVADRPGGPTGGGTNGGGTNGGGTNGGGTAGGGAGGAGARAVDAPTSAVPGLPSAAAARVEAVTLDVTDAADVARLCARVRPGAVVHLAAYGAGADGLAAGAAQAPGRATAVNVGGLVHVIEAAAAAGRAPVVWSSSTTVFGPAAGYGDPCRYVDEDAATRPTTVYGATKVAGEKLARVLAPALGTRVVGVRLPLVYGPGRWYGGSQEALVRYVDDLVGGRPARIRAWTRIVDWIHVDDAAAALLAATVADTTYDLYHVVGHRGSLAELAGQLAAAAGEPAQIEAEDGGPDLPLLATDRAERDLGFRPRFASSHLGAADYVARARAYGSGAESTGGQP